MRIGRRKWRLGIHVSRKIHRSVETAQAGVYITPDGSASRGNPILERREFLGAVSNRLSCYAAILRVYSFPYFFAISRFLVGPGMMGYHNA